MDYEKKARKINKITRTIRHLTGWALALAILFMGSVVYDIYTLTAEGLNDGEFPGFEELLSVNPDTVAWIEMDGTHIKHPVVQGKDNFEYLNKSFDGEFYQGGSIFLDSKNKKDLSDEYIIIHGHHMSRGAMFSDVSLYLEKNFFDSNKTGRLITPAATYELTVVGSSIEDAYDGRLYYVGEKAGRPTDLIDSCPLKRSEEFRKEDKLVMLSTCAGDMTTKRAIVFCRARKAD